VSCPLKSINVNWESNYTIMKENKTLLALIFLMLCFIINAQNNNAKSIQNPTIVNYWFEAPESSSGNTIVFKTSKHALGPNDNPAYAWSEFEIKADNTFDIKYWRFCPGGNYAYTGTWTSLKSGMIKMDFGMNKCKCELQIVSVTKNELTAIIKETTN
jgi:hypothetical protein